MTIANQNFQMYRGDSHLLQIELFQADGSPYDPTLGAKLKWYMTRSPADADDAAVRKSLGSGITGFPGMVEILLDPGDTDQPVGLYYHELKVWDQADVATAMTGFAVIKAGARMGDNITSLKADLVLSRTAPIRTP
jgi:hypothetical protein